MKNILLVFAFILPLTLGAQSNMSGISAALNKGDAATLSTYFDSTVEITILDNFDMLDKSEAKQMVAKFFAQNKPAGFSLKHNGNSKNNGSEYAIGSLNAGGKQYRVFILMKEEGGKSIIQQLQIEAN